MTKRKKQQVKLKAAARTILNMAVAAGRVIKPKRCEKCNLRSKRIEGHHTDYNKPVDVMWLCSECHGLAHSKYGQKMIHGLYKKSITRTIRIPAHVEQHLRRRSSASGISLNRLINMIFNNFIMEGLTHESKTRNSKVA